ncbi:hypothetical protein glysoja_032889 [Glycine soja]|uniref:Uncharacterized protein n=1 Tax=Glycine soja TaxID=3848 RepID=A0A0B2QZK7_GLYSO|nr:hypothetical protein glysoja_032889 [Glycine soja]
MKLFPVSSLASFTDTMPMPLTSFCYLLYHVIFNSSSNTCFFFFFDTSSLLLSSLSPHPLTH